MLPFLDKFLRNFPAVQTKQIKNKISQLRDSGEITNVKQLKDELKRLANIVSEDELKIRVPFLYFYDGDLLEADAFKTFMENVQLDMDACLGEVESLSDTIRAHQKLLVGNHFNAIDAAIHELEKRINGLELLSLHKYRGFNKIYTLDFSGAVSVPGASKQANNTSGAVISKSEDQSIPTTEIPLQGLASQFLGDLSTDKRGGQKLYWSPPLQGEGGIKLSSVNENVFFQNIRILGSINTTTSDIRNTEKENYSGNKILNAIDGKPDTFWLHTVKTRRPVNSCNLKLYLEFPSVKRINSILIDSASISPMTLISASYLNTGQKEVDISITETELPSSRKIIVDVGDITARGIFLTFKQSTGVPIDTVTNRSISGNTENFASSDVIKSWSSYYQENDTVTGQYWFDGTENVSYINYEFGFKDIYAINQRYEENGLFVPQTIGTKSIRSLSLFANITYPSQYSDIEFLIRKENITDGTSPLVDVFPVLPYGTTQLEERLFLSNKSIATSSSFDVGVLRFYPDFSSSFNIYSSGTLLSLGSDYEFSVDDGATFETSLSFLTSPKLPQRCFVKILSPRTDKIYTVVYSPLTSDQSLGGEVFIDSEKRIKLERNQTYVFKNNESSCNITLQIIIRSNSLDNKVTPVLKDIHLLIGEVNTNG